MSGRGAGFCAGYDMPGYANPGVFRRGMRMRAWGGRGWGNRFYAGGRHGWMGNAAYAVPYPVEMTPEEKQDMLKTRESWLQEQLNEVRQDMSEFEKDINKEKPAE
jgi:hypothetical protein